jgi:DNA-binding MarR family transcriptional regulator
MASSIFYPKNTTPPEVMAALARKYPELDPSSVETVTELLRVSIQILNSIDASLALRKTSRGKLSVLSQLDREPGGSTTPSKLADVMGVTRATITGLLDGLERDGLLQRKTGDDARSINVQLTTKGRQFISSIMPERYRRVRGLLAGLNEDQQRQLRGLLGEVAKGLPAFGGK